MARKTTLKDHTVDVGDAMLIVYKHGTVSCDIVRVTEKAIQIGSKDSKIKIWVPKSAVTVNEETLCEDFNRFFSVEVAAWFKGDVWYDRFLNDTFMVFALSW